MRCDDRRPTLLAAHWRDGDRASLDARPPGATSSSACAARPSWSSTASCCGPCGTLRTEVLEPAPGLLAEILATLEEAGERHAVRSLLTRPPGRLPRRARRGHRRRRRPAPRRAGHPLAPRSPARSPADAAPVDRRPRWSRGRTRC